MTSLIIKNSARLMKLLAIENSPDRAPVEQLLARLRELLAGRSFRPINSLPVAEAHCWHVCSRSSTQSRNQRIIINVNVAQTKVVLRTAFFEQLSDTGAAGGCEAAGAQVRDDGVGRLDRVASGGHEHADRPALYPPDAVQAGLHRLVCSLNTYASHTSSKC